MFLAVGDQEGFSLPSHFKQGPIMVFPSYGLLRSWPYGSLLPASHVTLKDKNVA